MLLFLFTKNYSITKKNFVIENSTILSMFKLLICKITKYLTILPDFQKVDMISIIIILPNLPNIQRYIMTWKNDIRKIPDIFLQTL